MHRNQPVCTGTTLCAPEPPCDAKNQPVCVISTATSSFMLPTVHMASPTGKSPCDTMSPKVGTVRLYTRGLLPELPRLEPLRADAHGFPGRTGTCQPYMRDKSSSSCNISAVLHLRNCIRGLED